VALLDCCRGNGDGILTCHQDGQRHGVPAVFWLRSDIDPLERRALELRHRGVDATAIDVAEECVEIMRDRGVAKAFHAYLYDYDGGRALFRRNRPQVRMPRRDRQAFTSLQVDYETLACASIREGWFSHRIASDPGHYLHA